MDGFSKQDISELQDRYYKLSPDQLINFWKTANHAWPLAKTFLHTHTDLGSPKDSILTVEKYIQTAKEFGAHSIAITDHGDMYAVQSLYDACQAAEIKLIVGIEFYVCDTVEDATIKNHTRLHLIAYAKDKIGYHALARLITASNTRIINSSFPCISKELLMKYIGPGSDGHGHIFLTSARIGGVLTGLAFQNENNKKNAAIIKTLVDECEEKLQSMQMLESELDKLGKQKITTKLIADKHYSKRKAETPEEVAALQKEKDETETAKTTVKKITAQMKVVTDALSPIRQRITAILKMPYPTTTDLATFIGQEKTTLTNIQNNIFKESDAAGLFEKEAIWYDELAGHGNWFIEVQYHGIEMEQRYMHQVVKIAKDHDIPLVAANDAHMQFKTDAKYRKIVNSMRFNKWEDLRDGDEELYLKDDVTLFKWLSKAISQDDAAKAMINRDIIIDGCNVDFTKEKHYPKYIM